ncbi:MAG: pyridoxamine 5'-phosphate oxidase family protein [Chloroflexota bacterium]
MARMSEEVKKAVTECKPGLVATASKTGKPNVSAKGSLRVLDEEHVVFADIMSPKTTANLRENPQVAVICIDPPSRSGCRISGKAEILTSGPLFDQLSQEYAARKMKVKNVVKVAVEESSTFKL